MDHNLQQWKLKIQEQRKKTPWREFVKEIVSRRPMIFHKWDGMISKYPQTDRVLGIQNSKDFELQRDGLLQYGRVYDAQQGFFEQFQKLLLSFPQEAMFSIGNCQNVSYADVVFDSQNAYMSYFVVFNCEDVLYSMVVRENSKRVFNSVMVFKGSENIYWSSGIISCYNVFYSKYLHNCSDIWFSTNLQGCRHCIMCDELENASYCIQNKQYTQKEYMVEKKKLLDQKERFLSRYHQLAISAKSFASQNSHGGFLTDCENVDNGYFSYNVHNARNIMFQGGEKTNEDVYDVFIGGASYSNHLYGIQGTGSSEHAYFCNVGVNNSNVFYCMGVNSCSYCFGCIGLRNKQYCILNKQYTKDDWYRIVDQIFTRMEQDTTFGKFFPGWMNPFYFNETCSVLIDDSFTKKEIEAEGYLWRDEKIQVDIPDWMEVVEVEDLKSYQGFDMDGNRKIDSGVLKKVIKDEEGNSYRIVKMEYDFLVKYGLPLPEIHWLERIKLGFKFE